MKEQCSQVLTFTFFNSPSVCKCKARFLKRKLKLESKKKAQNFHIKNQCLLDVCKIYYCVRCKLGLDVKITLHPHEHKL